jgi:lipoate-protein ligase B
MHQLTWHHLGRIRYADALRVQQACWQELVDGGTTHRLLTLEHDPVVTLGRRARREDLLVADDWFETHGVDVVTADRGGEVTYHGPGQLVLYLHVSTTATGLGPSDLVRSLANAIVDLAASLGIAASYDNAHPGVWVQERKLAAVGMRITRGASLHGAALNIATDLSVFDRFVPCGMPGAQAISLQTLLPAAPDLASCAADLAPRVAERLRMTLRTDCRDQPPPGR